MRMTFSCRIVFFDDVKLSPGSVNVRLRQTRPLSSGILNDGCRYWRCRSFHFPTQWYPLTSRTYYCLELWMCYCVCWVWLF